MSVTKNFELDVSKPFFYRDFDLFKKNASVQASAGTGKTFSIQRIVKNIVANDGKDLVGGEPVRLSEILIVTYTDKAAGELRKRIREILEEGAVDVSISADERDRIEIALRSIDQAPIYTIHSFCERVLQQYGFEAGVSGDTSLIDSKQIKKMVERRCRDKWIILEPGKENIFEKLITLPETGFSPQDIIDSVALLAEKYNPSLNHFADQVKDTKELEKKRDEHYSVELGALLKELSAAGYVGKLSKVNLKALDNEKILALYGESALKTDCNAYPQIEELIKKIAAYNGKTPGELRSKAVATYYTSLKENFCQQEAVAIYNEWQQYKLKNFSHTFDDLVEFVYKACLSCENSSLLKELRRKFRYGIIDEFQDTNLFQWSIFKKIFLECETNRVIVVGDPKQSIYKFQNADIAVYSTACNDIKKSKNGIKHDLELSKNFRSSKAIIEACNNICSALSKEGKAKVLFGDETVPFMDSGFGKADDSYKPTLNGEEVPAVWLSQLDVEPNDYATFAISQIAQMIGKVEIPRKGGMQSPLTYSDIAILARTHDELKVFEKALRKLKLPYLKYKDESLFKDVECSQWSVLLKAVATADNSEKSKKIKRSALVIPFFGKTLEEAYNFDFEKRDDAFAVNVGKWQKLSEDRNWALLIQSIFDDSSIEKDLLAEGRYQELAKYHQIGDYIVECLCQKNWSLLKMAAHLDNLHDGKESPIVQDAEYVSRESNKDLVQLMTIHASKGLEFPVVIVAGGKSAGKRNSPYIYSESSESGEPLRVISQDSSAKDIVYDEEAREWRRLFYVALTRAAFVMFLPRYAKPGRSPNGEGASELFMKPALNKTFENAPSEAFASYISMPQKTDDALKLEVDTSAQSVEEWNKKFASVHRVKKDEFLVKEADVQKLASELGDILDDDRRNGLYSRATSYSKLANHSENINGRSDESNVATDLPNEQTVVADKGASFDDANYPRGNVFGTAIHEVLEKMNFAKGKVLMDNAESGLLEKQLVQVESIFRHYGVDYDEQIGKDTIGILYRTMNASLPMLWRKDGVTFCLGDLPKECCVPEMQFNMGALKNVVGNVSKVEFCAKGNSTWFFNGFIDLMFCVDGKYCVLDWKGNYISDYSKNGVESNMESSGYFVQRALYSYIVVEWLADLHGVKEIEGKRKLFNDMFGGVYYCYLRGTKKDSDRGFSCYRYASYDDLLNDFKTQVEERLIKEKGL